jgi:hypothetical protein
MAVRIVAVVVLLNGISFLPRRELIRGLRVKSEPRLAQGIQTPCLDRLEVDSSRSEDSMGSDVPLHDGRMYEL